MVMYTVDVYSGSDDSIIRDPHAQGVIVKATQGTGYVNPKCNHQWDLAGELGKKRGLYHYAGGGDPVAEAQYFINNIKNYAGGIHADFCVEVHGDSMIGANIHNGDIVFIRQQNDVENGEIAAVLIDDSATLKRFYHDGDTVTLIAENPKYPPMVFHNGDCEKFEILGKAVALQTLIK